MLQRSPSWREISQRGEHLCFLVLRLCQPRLQQPPLWSVSRHPHLGKMLHQQKDSLADGSDDSQHLKAIKYFLVKVCTWLRWWRICPHCKRPRVNPWVRKIPWRRKWQLTAVFVPGKFHGQRSLMDCSPWDHKESDMTERLTLPLSPCF